MAHRKGARRAGGPSVGRAERKAGGGKWAPGLDAVDRLAGRKGPCPACGAKLERDEWIEGCAICDRGTCQRCNEWSALDVDFRGKGDSSADSLFRFCSEACALAALRRFIQSTPPGAGLLLLHGGGSGTMLLLGPPFDSGLRSIHFRRLRPEAGSGASRRGAPRGGGGGPELLDMAGFASKARKELKASGRPFKESKDRG